MKKKSFFKHCNKPSKMNLFADFSSEVLNCRQYSGLLQTSRLVPALLQALAFL